MVPAGYLLKRVVAPPPFLSDARIVDVCSVADCVNDDVIDVQIAWQHNGFGVANDARSLLAAVPEGQSEGGPAVLFYYEAYEEEISSDGWTFDACDWVPLSQLTTVGTKTAVVPPPTEMHSTLIGYDVVVFGDYLEHSPLSCNGIAVDLPVNDRCLFATLEAAKAAIDDGKFGGGCEEGIYRIFSVHVLSEAETAT